MSVRALTQSRRRRSDFQSVGGGTNKKRALSGAKKGTFKGNFKAKIDKFLDIGIYRGVVKGGVWGGGCDTPHLSGYCR